MIEKDMIILDVVMKYPKTEAVFRKYDDVAGVCIMCHHLFDSIEDLSVKYSIDINNIMLGLNEHMDA